MSVRSSRRTPLINGAVSNGNLAVFDGTDGSIKDGGAPGGTGTVTNTGTLTANQVVIGNGGVDVTVLGTLGTTTTVLHGNAAGAPTFGAVNLAAGGDTTGDLPFASFVQSTAASKLVGRGSASGAGDFEEITLGGNLSMSGTTLSATGGGASGIVTATGTLTANQLIIGNGSTDITALGTLGTTTTLLHGNAAGAPTFAQVSLTADVTGDLPFSNLVQASGGSLLVGRRAGSSGDFEEITPGTGLSFSTTTLNNTRTILQFCYGATTGWNPGDGAVAYFGLNTGFNPTATTDGGFRVICPVTGTVKAVYLQIQVTGTLGTAGVDSTFEVRNVTANTNETISSVVRYSAATQDYSNEAMTLAVTKGDALLIKCTMGTWATNPTATFGYFTMVLA